MVKMNSRSLWYEATGDQFYGQAVTRINIVTY